MLARVEESYRRPSRLIFLPYLSGERTPHNNAEARGVLFGLDPATEKTDVIQAVLEGVAFSLKDAKDCLEAAGCPCSEPAFIGGGARSAFWGRIVATVLGQPIMRFRGTDLGPAFGAARLAIIASTGAAVSAICRPPEDKEIIEPDGRLIADYAKRHQRFRALYKSLVGLFDKAEEGGT
jgi:xylulokinase